GARVRRTPRRGALGPAKARRVLHACRAEEAGLPAVRTVPPVGPGGDARLGGEGRAGPGPDPAAGAAKAARHQCAQTWIAEGSFVAGGAPRAHLRIRIMARARKVKAPFPNTGSEEVPPGATGKAADRDSQRPLREARHVVRLTGLAAIEYAEKKSLTLNKHPDRLEGPRQGLTVPEAVAVAGENPELIWLDIDEDDYDALTDYEAPP